MKKVNDNSKHTAQNPAKGYWNILCMEPYFKVKFDVVPLYRDAMPQHDFIFYAVSNEGAVV